MVMVNLTTKSIRKYLLEFSAIFLGDLLKGADALVGLIGVGTMIAGYLYPNTERIDQCR
jgi:hypothetical protein